MLYYYTNIGVQYTYYIIYTSIVFILQTWVAFQMKYLEYCIQNTFQVFRILLKNTFFFYFQVGV